MSSRQKRLYLLAVYLLIAITAFTFMALGFTDDDSWKSILLSLSTELLAVALVFFLVDFLFSIDDWNLSEKVKQLLIQLQQKRPQAVNFFEPTPRFENIIANAEQIDLCGVTLTTTVSKNFSNIRQRLFEGANVRILIMKPNYLTWQMAMERSENRDSIDYYKRRLEATLNDIEYMYKNYQEKELTGAQGLGTFNVKLMKYAPSFGMASFDTNKVNAKMFVEIYPHHAGYGSPPQFSLTKQNDPEWHKYFSEQFEEMWTYAEEWTLGTSVELMNEAPNLDNVTISDFFHPQKLNHDFSETETVYILGLTLSQTLRTYKRELRQRYASGATIKIILLDPMIESILEEFAIWTSLKDTDASFWKTRLESNVKYITGGILDTPPSNNLGTVEIGYLPFIPSFGLIILNPEHENGICTVEMYHHKSDTTELTFDLVKSVDPELYDFYLEQFAQLWNSCRIEKVSSE